MASIVLGGIGSIIGGPFGGAVGGVLGKLVDARLFGAKQKKLNYQDSIVQSSAWGAPITLAYNRCKIAGNLIMSTPIQQKKTKTRGGGKGGGGGKGSQQNSFYVTCAIGICKGPIKNIWRVFADTKLLWDMNPNKGAAINGGFIATPGGNGFVITGAPDQTVGSVGKGGSSARPLVFGSATLYLGTEDQVVDPICDSLLSTIENLGGLSAPHPGECPAYRGLAYVVFIDFNLDPYGGRIPNFTFEVNGSNDPINNLGVP